MADNNVTSCVYEQRFSVPFDYPVHFTRSLFDPANPLFADVVDRRQESRRHRVLVCVDSGVCDANPDLAQRIEAYCSRHGETIELVAPPYPVPGGEKAKNAWDDVRRIMATIGEQHLCRQSFVVAVGGGSVLDVVGFAAGLVHRGVRLIRVPTTVLAQNDAGVGVKNGMNAHGNKNFVGVFAPPFAVINDRDFLTTLSDRDWIGGVAEAFKVAIIKDAEFLEYLCQHAALLKARDMATMERVVYRCAVLHLEHIRGSGDPFEFGSSRPLDFGHWAGHRLELTCGPGLGHGQAVSIGMAVDACYARRKGLIDEAQLQKILAGLTACGLPVWRPELAHTDEDGRLCVLAGLEQFREHLGGSLTIAMPDSLGSMCEINCVDENTVAEAVEFLRASYESS